MLATGASLALAAPASAAGRTDADHPHHSCFHGHHHYYGGYNDYNWHGHHNGYHGGISVGVTIGVGIGIGI